MKSGEKAAFRCGWRLEMKEIKFQITLHSFRHQDEEKWERKHWDESVYMYGKLFSFALTSVGKFSPEQLLFVRTTTVEEINETF